MVKQVNLISWSSTGEQPMGQQRKWVELMSTHVHTCPQAHTQTPTGERERDKSQAITRETRGPRQETVGFIWHNLVTMELHGRRGIHVREQQHLTWQWHCCTRVWIGSFYTCVGSFRVRLLPPNICMLGQSVICNSLELWVIFSFLLCWPSDRLVTSPGYTLPWEVQAPLWPKNMEILIYSKWMDE